MYFIEFIIKKLTQRKEKPTFNPLESSGIEDYEYCEHTFMPIDSTNETLSCIKCGAIAKRSELRSRNFFNKK